MVTTMNDRNGCRMLGLLGPLGQLDCLSRWALAIPGGRAFARPAQYSCAYSRSLASALLRGRLPRGRLLLRGSRAPAPAWLGAPGVATPVGGPLPVPAVIRIPAPVLLGLLVVGVLGVMIQI